VLYFVNSLASVKGVFIVRKLRTHARMRVDMAKRSDNGVCLSACRLLGFAAAVTPVTGTLVTAGTSLVDVAGRNLGLNTSVVFISYGGGSPGLATRTYTTTAGSCTIVAAGIRLRCPTLPGVGTNFRFAVHVDGAASDASADTLSYAPPTISDVTVPGVALVPLAGAVTVSIRGSNFGPVAANTTLRVWAVPTADQTRAFMAQGCEVVEAHVTIHCTLGNRLGAQLNFRVQVEGQDNTLPQISLSPPRVTRVFLSEAFANTRGGSQVNVEGYNFGSSAPDTRVFFTTLGGTVDAANCSFLTNDTLLQCVLPAGAGVFFRVSVTALDQTGSLDVTGLAYARPTLAFVSPATWPTDVMTMTVTLTGSGFGSSASVVSVTAREVGSACADIPGVMTVVASGISVLSDSELMFSFRTPAPHVAAGWALTVTIAGQGLAPEDAASAAAAIVPTQAPSAPTITIAQPSNGTHSFLLLTGMNYGSVVSSCAGDAAVLVGNQPCDRLTVVLVGLFCPRLSQYFKAFGCKRFGGATGVV
jgi:hypothetical protein